MHTTIRVFMGAALAMSVATAVHSAETSKTKGKTKADLPPAVAKVVEQHKPGAEIDVLEVENEAGVTLYDIEFKGDAGEIEVAADGTVMDIATIVQLGDLPKAAADALQKAAGSAQIGRLEKSEVQAEIQKEGGKGRVVKRPASKYVYEAELSQGTKKGEVQVDADGQIVEGPKWGEKK